MSNRRNVTPNDLSAFWMPFTANRQFKKAPRMFVGAKDMHYTTSDGRQVLDGTAGLWCVNAGHCRPQIIEAIQRAGRRAGLRPGLPDGPPQGLRAGQPAGRHRARRASNHVLLHQLRLRSRSRPRSRWRSPITGCKGEGARFRLIGRERGYHGVNFGGISVGGIVTNRKMFGTLLTGVDHMPHTHTPAQERLHPRRARAWRANLADELERIVTLHDASTIAAVIVEPVAGSTGVLIPPKGYLEKLREITKKHGILLIFDEVITGFGRLGTPFAADYFDVMPDIITTRQGPDQRRDPDGRGVRDLRDPRRLHERPRAHDRVLPRLHLFGQPDRLAPPASPRSRPTRRRACSTRGAELAALLGGRAAFAQGPAARHRHPQHRPDRRDRARADRRRSRPSAPSPPS